LSSVSEYTDSVHRMEATLREDVSKLAEEKDEMVRDRADLLVRITTLTASLERLSRNQLREE